MSIVELLISLPSTFDDVMRIDPVVLMNSIVNSKFDDYEFLLYFPVSFICGLIDVDKQLYYYFPDRIKYDERVIAKCLTKLVMERTDELELGFALDVMMHCPYKKLRRIRRTLKSLKILA